MGEEKDINTLVLYGAVVFFSSAFSIAACRNTYKKDAATGTANLHINLFLFASSFLICWGLIAFSTCGQDYLVYKNMFLNATSISDLLLRYGIELGYAFLNYIVRLFTSNSELFFAILAFLFVFPIYHTLYKMRAYIHPAWGVFVFTTVFFFQAINLRRMYLVATLLFWATSFLIEKKYIKYVVILIICTLIHVSSIIMVIPLIYDLFVGKKISKWALIILSSVLIIIMYYFRDIIFSFSISNRYINYGVQNGGIGILQFIYHAPIIYALFKHKANSEVENRYRDIGLLYALMSFAIGIFSYFVLMIGRAFVYFIFPFVLAPSYSTNPYVGHESKHHLVLTPSKVWKIGFILYYIIRLILYFNEYLFLDGIMPYQSIFS